jgi:hypothetical protein
MLIVIDAPTTAEMSSTLRSLKKWVRGKEQDCSPEKTQKNEKKNKNNTNLYYF